jgi:hypothetical protein
MEREAGGAVESTPPSIPHSPRISLVFFIGFTCLFQAFGGICTSSLYVETPRDY